MEQLSKKTLLLINLICVQAFLVLFASFWVSNESYFTINIHGWLVRVIPLLGVVLTVMALFLLREIIRLSQKERQAGISSLRLAESQELIDTLEIQRHDFLNHLQVISGLIQLKKYNEVAAYINEITGEIGIATKISNIKQAEFAAFLMKKIGDFNSHGVTLKLDLKSEMDNLTMPPSEIISLLGNLLDNAFQAIEGLPENQKIIYLHIGEGEEFYHLKINNPGPPIPADIAARIFEKGFSTKNGTGRGYGLHIVKTLTEKNFGKLVMHSDESEGTTFLISLPKALDTNLLD